MIREKLPEVIRKKVFNPIWAAILPLVAEFVYIDIVMPYLPHDARSRVASGIMVVTLTLSSVIIGFPIIDDILG